MSPTTKLWRYMNFEKFKDMIANRSVFFCRLDKFDDDAFEGAGAESDLIQRRKLLASPGERRDYLDRLALEKRRTVKEIKEEVLDYCHKRMACDRARFAVWCWRRAAVESSAMWKLYAGKGAGVAVQTTIGLLNRHVEINCFNYNPNVRGVIYINRKKYKSTIPFDERPFYKDKFYESEREVRAVLTHSAFYPNPGSFPDPGISFQCENLNFLQKVVISPFADKVDIHAVREVIEQYSPELRIVPSEMLNAPCF